MDLGKASNKPTQKKRSSTLIRRVSITTVTLAGALATANGQAQSNDQCETNPDIYCNPIMFVSPFFSPIDELNEVPFFQSDDWRDELPDRHDGDGPGSPPPDDEPDNDDMCISNTSITDILTPAQAIDYNHENGGFEGWVATVAGGVTGAVVAFVNALRGDDTMGPFVGGSVGASVSYWLNRVLSPGPVHCGDRIIVETTVCIPPPVLQASAANLTVQAIDTRVEHLHSSCDFYGINPPTPPPFEPPILPHGEQSGSNSRGASSLQFELSLNGVTHAFEEEPSARDLQMYIFNIQNPKPLPFGTETFETDSAIKAFDNGIEAGIKAFEEFLETTDVQFDE